MNPRPTSLTVISWLLVSSGIFFAILQVGIMSCRDPHVAIAVSNSPVPVSIQCGFSLLGSLVTVISGFGMLKRQNWARLLYLLWMGFSQVVVLVASPDKLSAIPGLILFALIALFLFLPNTVAYFQKKPEDEGA